MSLSHLDPRTKECELPVQKIIHLQNLVNQLPYAFTNPKRVTTSYIPAANAPVRIDVPVGQSVANEPKASVKRGRPVGSKDKNPRKRKGSKDQVEELMALEESPVVIPEKIQVPETYDNQEISINYVTTSQRWNRNKIDVDDIFAYNVALNIVNDNEDLEPKSIEECRQRDDWPKWKDAIEAELNSLSKHEVFCPIVLTPDGVKPVGYKWVFVRKRDATNKVVRYKVRLVAQGFSQRPGIDYEETYSPVVDATTFRYLISLAIHEKLGMCLMDVVTAYLYGPLDCDIYMKIPKGLKLLATHNSGPRELYSIKLCRSLYGLKQSGHMWYNRLSEYLLRKRYKNDPLCPCVFIKRSGFEFVIIVVYVDDLNIIGTMN